MEDVGSDVFKGSPWEEVMQTHSVTFWPFTWTNGRGRQFLRGCPRDRARCDPFPVVRPHTAHRPVPIWGPSWPLDLTSLSNTLGLMLAPNVLHVHPPTPLLTLSPNMNTDTKTNTSPFSIKHPFFPFPCFYLFLFFNPPPPSLFPDRSGVTLSKRGGEILGDLYQRQFTEQRSSFHKKRP